MSRRTAAGGQRSDSDPQRFFSTVSSAAEAAVLQGGIRKNPNNEQLLHCLPYVVQDAVRDEEVCRSLTQ